MKRRSLLPFAAAAPAAWLAVSCREGAERPRKSGAQGESKGTDPGGGSAEKPPREERDEDFLGLDLAEAERLAARRKLSHRVVVLEGRPRPATKDYRPDRVNFEVEGGRIAKVSRG